MRIAPLFAVFAGSAGCSLSGQDHDALYQIGGRVRGLWSGASGVGLQLSSLGGNASLTVTGNRKFIFPALLADGAPYTVSVVGQPASHTCTIEDNATGVVAAAEFTEVSVSCVGPDVMIAFFAAQDWSFDPMLDMQLFRASSATQDVALTVSGAGFTGVAVDGAAVLPGVRTPPIALPIGTTIVPVVVAVNDGLSRSYALVFDRAGGDQAAIDR